MLKREWGAENKGKLPHLLIYSKTATWVPEFAMEDLPLGRIASLVPEFAVKDLPLGRTQMMMMIWQYEPRNGMEVNLELYCVIQLKENKLINYKIIQSFMT